MKPAALRLGPIALSLIAAFGWQTASALPVGHQVVNGTASITQTANAMNITNSNGAIINWQKFSISAGNQVHFTQPSALSAVLNRVTGGDPSRILGTLTSNGKVFLVNPNGIVFGAGARIDTAGLVASTLDIANQDFLAGKMKFTAGPNAGKLENQGNISVASGGEVWLIAPDVKNTGVITAPNGDILLAAGKEVHLVDSRNPEVALVVRAPENEALNLGTLQADAGRIGMYGGVIRQQGIVSANSAVADKNGRIFFKATQAAHIESGATVNVDGIQGGDVLVEATEGTATVSGTITARGNGGQGGTVQVLGKNAGLLDQAVVDASGKTGGGTVLIGGDYLGGNPEIKNAQFTYTGKDTQIHADALDTGQGGKVIIWADDSTRAYGRIYARGGKNGGDGGFVETSGKRWLDVGLIPPDASAYQGKAGLWLLDPYHLTIGGNVTVNGANSSVNSGLTAYTPSNNEVSDLTIATLKTALETTNVTVSTTDGNITLSSALALGSAHPGRTLTLSAGASSQDDHGDITLNANISMTGDNNYLNLALVAGGKITIETSKKVTLYSASASSPPSDFTSNGTFTATSKKGFEMKGGSVITAGGEVRIENGDSGGSGNIVINGAIQTSANTISITNKAAQSTNSSVTMNQNGLIRFISYTDGQPTLLTGANFANSTLAISSKGPENVLSTVFAGTLALNAGESNNPVSYKVNETGVWTAAINKLEAGNGSPLASLNFHTGATSNTSVLEIGDVSATGDVTINGGAGGLSITGTIRSTGDTFASSSPGKVTLTSGDGTGIFGNSSDAQIEAGTLEINSGCSIVGMDGSDNFLHTQVKTLNATAVNAINISNEAFGDTNKDPLQITLKSTSTEAGSSLITLKHQESNLAIVGEVRAAGAVVLEVDNGALVSQASLAAATTPIVQGQRVQLTADKGIGTTDAPFITQVGTGGLTAYAEEGSIHIKNKGNLLVKLPDGSQSNYAIDAHDQVSLWSVPNSPGDMTIAGAINAGSGITLKAGENGDRALTLSANLTSSGGGITLSGATITGAETYAPGATINRTASTSDNPGSPAATVAETATNTAQTQLVSTLNDVGVEKTVESGTQLANATTALEQTSAESDDEKKKKSEQDQYLGQEGPQQEGAQDGTRYCN